jgi:predicted Zn-dependent peptidase
MKKLVLICICALGLLPAHAGAPLELPAVQSFSLPNGLTCYYIHDELPRTLIVLSAGSGYLFENEQTAGLSDLLARTMRQGGSRDYPGQKLHEGLDRHGAGLGVASSWEELSVSAEVLSDQLEPVWKMFADQVCAPMLDDASRQLAASILREEIIREEEKPFSQAYNSFREIAFQKKTYGVRRRADAVNGYTRRILPHCIKSLLRAQYGSGNCQQCAFSGISVHGAAESAGTTAGRVTA